MHPDYLYSIQSSDTGSACIIYHFLRKPGPAIHSPATKKARHATEETDGRKK